MLHFFPETQHTASNTVGEWSPSVNIVAEMMSSRGVRWWEWERLPVCSLPWQSAWTQA